jgi:hypothetical protein
MPIGAETVSESSNLANKSAAKKKRAVRNGQGFLMALRSFGIALLVLIMGQVVLAQTGAPISARAADADRVTIVNPQHREIPEDRVRVLFLTTCRVVAEEFHRHPSEVNLKLTLVMGDKNERSMTDVNGHLAVYMDRWNEGKFVDGVITGAVQQLTTLQARNKMFQDILRRSDQIAPVSVNRLRDAPPNRPSPTPNLGPDCFSAISNAACPWLPRTVPQH